MTSLLVAVRAWHCATLVHGIIIMVLNTEPSFTTHWKLLHTKHTMHTVAKTTVFDFSLRFSLKINVPFVEKWRSNILLGHKIGLKNVEMQG